MAAAKRKPGSTKRAGVAARPDPSHRIVVLAGPDEFLRALHTKHLRNALTTTFGSVAESQFAGKNASPADVLDACRGFSLLGEHNLVVVDEADEFLKVGARPLIERYAASPAEQSTLVLRARVWNRGKLDKAISAVGVIVKCDQPSAEQALAWVHRLCAEQLECAIDDAAAAALVRRLGPDLGALNAELRKLASAVGEGERITPALVDQFVARSRDEQAWAIQDALLTGGAAGALLELRDIMQSFPRESDASAPTSWALADLARKLHVASAELAQGASATTAAKAAGVWGPSRDALLQAARRRDPAALAALLQDAVAVNAATKSGAQPRLALETLLIRFDRVLHK